MDMKPADITRTLISSDFIFNHMYSLFPDSIFLNQDLRIVGASISIQKNLGYSLADLEGQLISFFDDSGSFENRLRQKLQHGYFNNEKFVANKRNGERIHFSVSGFYLGLLMTQCGLIVLRFDNQEEVEALDRKLLEAKNQVDNFIYWSAHDLRGPLATIHGLVNLLKIRKDDTEVDRFVHMIEANCTNLSERLSSLVYLARAAEETQVPTFILNFTDLETRLRKVIEKNAFVDFLELIVSAHAEKVCGFSEIHVEAILTNIVCYILSLPTCDTANFIRINAGEKRGLLEITIQAEGFEPDPNMQRNMEEINTSMYADLSKTFKYTYLFAAQKIALQYKSLITVDAIGKSSLSLSIAMTKSENRTLTNQ